MKSVHMVLFFAPISFSTASTKSMKFKGRPVAGFTSFSSSTSPSAVCVNQRLLLKAVTQKSNFVKIFTRSSVG